MYSRNDIYDILITRYHPLRERLIVETKKKKKRNDELSGWKIAMKSCLKEASEVEIIYETLWLLEKRRTMLLLSLLFSRKGGGEK